MAKESGVQLNARDVRSLKDRLLAASLSFHSDKGRRVTKKKLIYSSFSLPGFEVKEKETQRNTVKRLERFGINQDAIFGKSVLDLGCHTGAILFEVQKWNPGYCLGIEYDIEKVSVAEGIARLCNIRNIEFGRDDIDELNEEHLGGKYDVVFCLAVEAHVTYKKRLYRLLNSVTNDVLYFEGNSTTDVSDVINNLTKVGFNEVEFLGMCDDDCTPENNNRPMFIARVN